MIKLFRGIEPDLLQGLQIQHARLLAANFFSSSDQLERQQTPIWTPLTKLIAELLKVSNGKCSYCEQSLKDKSTAIDFFRPRDGAVDLDGHFSREHYWWLAYTWENIFPSCRECNVLKADRFPIDGKRCEIGAPYEDTLSERALLLDPVRDFPENEFSADLESGMLIAITQRAQVSLNVLALNRPGLIELRRAAIANAQDTMSRWVTGKQRQDIVEHINNIEGGKTPFSLFGRAVLRSHGFKVDDSHDISNVKSEVADFHATITLRAASETSSASYIESVHIKNFRALDDLRLNFLAGGAGAPWSMIIGENGVGKSSVLQAIALVFRLGAHLSTSLRPQDILRRHEMTGSIEVLVTSANEPMRVDFDLNGGFHYSGSRPKAKLAAYGANRIVSGRKRRRRFHKQIHTGNLFNPYYSLTSPKQWLESLSDDNFNYSARILKNILALKYDDVLIRADTGQVIVTVNNEFTDFASFSDGLKSTSALVADLSSFLQTDKSRSLESEQAIVLLDEIGANLHPRWKMLIVGALRASYPKVQFISTTHDPLCLRGLTDGEAFVLKRNHNNLVRAVEDLPSVSALRVDQLLTSEYFGLNSTYDVDIESKFNEYYLLLSRRHQLTVTEQERVNLLKVELECQTVLGATRRERLLLDFVDRYLVESISDETDQEQTFHQEVDTEIRDQLERMMRGQGYDSR